jgi:hypothetical protein
VSVLAPHKFRIMMEVERIAKTKSFFMTKRSAIEESMTGNVK